MKSPLSWLLLLTVILGIQLSQCGVINPHQRDLLWAEEKSVEISNVEKRHNRHSQSNSTARVAGTISQNETLTSNETHSSKKTIHDPIVNKTDVLSVNTSNIDSKVTEISQEELTERQIRSNGPDKPCRSQLLSYNPLTFTSHEVGKEYNPPQPHPSTKPKPALKYNNPEQLPAYTQRENGGNQNKYPLASKVPHHSIENTGNIYSSSNPVKYGVGRPSHLLCKGGYNYSDKEGVCVPMKQRPQPPAETNSYPLVGRNQLQLHSYNSPSTSRELVRPQVKQYGLQPGSSPSYNDERNVQYNAQTAGVGGADEYNRAILRPNVDSSLSGPIKDFLPKPKYPAISNNKAYNPPHYHPPNYRGQSQYNQGENQIQAKPKPYPQNEPQNAYANAPTGQAAQYPQESEEPPSETYATVSKNEQPKEMYEQSQYEQPSYNSQIRNHDLVGPPPRQDNQYAEEKISRPKVSYAAEENYPSSYLADEEEDVEPSEDQYEHDYEKSSSDKKCIPLKQYLAEKDSSHKYGNDGYDSSENSSYSPSAPPKYGRYSSKSSSKPSGKRRKSSRNENYNQRKSYYVNPYTNLYKIKDSNEYTSHRHKKPNYYLGKSKIYPSNYEMTYDDESHVRCKKPKALNEIILPKGGIILEGEYVLQRKPGSRHYEGDYDKHKHCPNYPRIIDRITIGKGGYIHKGKYTLDKDDRKYYTDHLESDGYNIRREKKEIDSETDDEDQDVKITIPFQIEAEDDDGGGGGVHLSTAQEIGDEMFEDEELEEKMPQKRQAPRLPTIIVPVDLNLVDPLIKGAAKITNDVNKLKLQIKKKELQRQVKQAVKNLKNLNHDHKEKMEKLKSDLQKKLEGNSVQKTPLVNRDVGNNVKTLSTTFNFNTPQVTGPLGSPIFRRLREFNPKLPENPSARAHLPERFAENDSDEDENTVFVRRQSMKPRTYYDRDGEDQEPAYQRKKATNPKRARHQYEDGDSEMPSRFSLFDPAPVPAPAPSTVKKMYRSQPPLTCPAKSNQGPRSHSNYYDNGRIEEVTKYDVSLMPLVRKGIHKVKSLIYDVPENYPPPRRLRSPVVYEEARPQKVSRSVFNEDGFWYEKDFTEMTKLQRPREIVYSDVIYAGDPDADYYTDYN